MGSPSEPTVERHRTRANGEGGVRHDKENQRWVGTVTVGWREVTDRSGVVRRRQIRKSVSGKTKKETVARMRQIQSLADADLPIPPRTLTVGAMLD